MSDQHVVTDWRAYFEALGPGSLMSPEQLEAMRDKDPRPVLLLDAEPGNLMRRHPLEADGCFAQAFDLWCHAGKPRAWITLGELVWWCDAAPSSLPSKSKVRSRS